MKPSRLAALALFACAPAFAAPVAFTLDFEKTWAFGTGVAEYYNGGTADDGSTASANVGVSFTNVFGFSNDAASTNFANAPSSLGVAYADNTNGAAYMNVAAGVDSSLSFYYAAVGDAAGAIKVYSGLNGTGTLLGTFDLAATSTTGAFDSWKQQTISFSGVAQSFDLSGTTGVAALDNVSAVPEPSSVTLMLAGVAVLVGMRTGRRQA
ncbi:PEP-CTERM sorting domain-containing protein [Roseateles koreensis]|uniref:PEP-CTERM sorting domain-containing protein n=1 Tax=Roseateles koreensis TaxID=2987526 RepID=A0ABT5KWR1_9BURK|nr:PEP-CTERM sorting domain-containing protein [Roseateles koreensis]MDC8786261.1 PEP-CTERM sorting domain-containing protein [Roseateles koreensis]